LMVGMSFLDVSVVLLAGQDVALGEIVERSRCRLVPAELRC
jgi:hypothetical protein